MTVRCEEVCVQGGFLLHSTNILYSHVLWSVIVGIVVPLLQRGLQCAHNCSSENGLVPGQV